MQIIAGSPGWNVHAQHQTQQFDIGIWYDVNTKPRRYFIVVNGMLPVSTQEYIEKFGYKSNVVANLTKSEAEKEAVMLVEKIERLANYTPNWKRGMDWNKRQQHEIKSFETKWGVSISTGEQPLSRPERMLQKFARHNNGLHNDSTRAQTLGGCA